MRSLNFAVALLLASAGGTSFAAGPDLGPYNARFLEGGVGIDRVLPTETPIIAENASISLTTWVKPDRVQAGFVPLISVGRVTLPDCRCLGLVDGRPALLIDSKILAGTKLLPASTWHHLAVTIDRNTARLFVDGREIAARRVNAATSTPVIGIAPVALEVPSFAHFGGALVSATVETGALQGDEIARRAASPPPFDLVQMRDVGVGWQLQKQANIGLTEQQDAWLLPKSNSGVSQPIAKPLPKVEVLAASGQERWQINGWQLISGPQIGKADGAALSRSGVDTSRWHMATVPGTVLTTLIDRGVYLDPYYGLNNMTIPDVIVLGADASGLNAAWLLEQQGMQVLVLEGRKRVGGRVLTLFGQPGFPEMGFNSMAAGYRRGIDAAKRAGVEL